MESSFFQLRRAKYRELSITELKECIGGAGEICENDEWCALNELCMSGACAACIVCPGGTKFYSYSTDGYPTFPNPPDDQCWVSDNKWECNG